MSEARVVWMGMNSAFCRVVVEKNGRFFVMGKLPDGTFVRATGGGMELHTRDLDYAYIGAKTCATKRTAVGRAKSELQSGE